MNMLKYSAFAALLVLVVGCSGGERLSLTQSSSLSSDRVPAFILSDEGSVYTGETTPFVIEQRLDAMTGELEVRVWARDARDLKAAALSLTYPADSYRLVEAEYADGLGGQDAISAVIPRAPQVFLGAAIIHFGERPGVSGDCDLFRLVFRPGAETLSRVVCDAPRDPNYNAVHLTGSMDANNVVTLQWDELNSGDGDNSGDVSIADISPIAMNYGDSSIDGIDDDEDFLADYDRNGTVGISDITPMAMFYGVDIAGYQVQIAVPPSEDFTDIPGGMVLREDINPNPRAADGPLEYVYSTEPIDGRYSYRVVPKDAEGNEGVESANVVTFEGITEILSLEIRPSDPAPFVITEEALDDIEDNEQPFVNISIQLEAWAMVEGKDEMVDVTGLVDWMLESGGNSATLGDTPEVDKGLLTATDVGVARVVAHDAKNFAMSAAVEIPIYSILDITLRVEGQEEPEDVSVSLGTPVDFEAIGIFDDNDGDAEDYMEIDITPYVSWAIGRPVADEGPPVVYEAGTFSIDTGTGMLYTDDPNLEAGFRAFVTAVFPPEAVEPTIGEGYRANSNMITVTLE